MSSARTLEKYKYAVGDNRTHDTQHYPQVCHVTQNSTHSSEWVMQKTDQICFRVR